MSRCILCDGDSSRPHVEDNGWTYHKCDGCGFVYLDPRPTPEEVRDFYDGEAGMTFHRSADEARDDEGKYEAHLRYRLLKPFLDRCAPKRAVEIGCGAGYFLRQLKRCGWDVIGAELGAVDVPWAEVVRGGVEAIPKGPYGLVILFDVLSHFHDPIQELRRIRNLLSPDGLLVMETGNGAEVDPSRVPHWCAPEHLWNFGEKSLSLLLDHAGFENVKLVRRNAEWQWRLLHARSRVRVGGGNGGGGGEAVPSVVQKSAGRSLAKRLASRALLATRYVGGRFLADEDHHCTLFQVARPGGDADDDGKGEEDSDS